MAALIKPGLVIFDCDGTLVDSELLNNQGTIDVLESLGIHGYTLDHAYLHWMGTTYSAIRLAVQMETGRMLPENFVMRCVERVAELQQKELRPVAHALDMVAQVQQACPSCVASNGERANVINSLRLTGFGACFTEETIFTKIQVERPKPAPDLYLYAAERMGVEPARCVVIEDSEPGVTAGVAAGMCVIGFTGSAHAPEKQGARLEAAGAMTVVSDLIHIPSLLEL